MICNKCFVQMHQKDKLGGGRAEETEYTTWEIKECPVCGRKVVEHYTAIEIKDEKEIEIKETIKTQEV